MYNNNSVISKRRLLTDVIKENGYKVGVEIGVDLGKFSAHLLRYSDLEMLHMIGPWNAGGLSLYRLKAWLNIPQDTETRRRTYRKEYCDKSYAHVVRGFRRKFPNRHNIIRDFSENAAMGFEDGSLDFIYIDGDHSYNGAMTDLKCWWPKLRKGGMLCGHDFKNRGRCRVKDAVTEFFADLGLRFKTTNESCKSWWIIKK